MSRPLSPFRAKCNLTRVRSTQVLRAPIDCAQRKDDAPVGKEVVDEDSLGTTSSARRLTICARSSASTPPIRPATNASPPIFWRRLGARVSMRHVEPQADARQPRRAVAGPRSRRAPLMLSSHTDVVPVEAAAGRATLRRRDRTRLRLGPRLDRYESQVRDGSWDRARAQARRRACRTATWCSRRWPTRRPAPNSAPAFWSSIIRTWFARDACSTRPAASLCIWASAATIRSRWPRRAS